MWLSIQLQVDVDKFPVHTVPQGAIWSSVYVNIQEGKMAISLSLHSELYVRMDVVEVVEEVLQLFRSMRPDHECVIHVMEPTYGPLSHHAECYLLKVFHEEVGNNRWQLWTHGNSVHLFLDLAIETEGGGSEDVVE